MSENITISASTENGYAEKDGAAYQKVFNTEIYTGPRSSATGLIFRGYVEWDISAIPVGSTITDVIFKFESSYDRVGEVTGIFEVTVQPSATAAQALYDHIGTLTQYVPYNGYVPPIGPNKQVDLGAAANTDLEADLAQGWFAIGMRMEDEVPGAAHKNEAIRSSRQGGVTPPPTLYVEYDPPASAELSGKFIVRHKDSEELKAGFDAQAVQNLPAVFCVHTVRVAQDLAKWTEYDSAAFLTHDCNEVNWTDLTRAATDTALTKTDLVNGLGTRVFHRLEANLYAVEETPNGATERVILWAGHLADVSHDFYGQNDFEIVALILHATSIADQYQLELREKGGNSSFMVTTWPNFQSRYIQIYKEGAYIRASVWQTDAYDKGTLDDWCEINLSGDLDFDYVSVAMSYGQAGAETSSGYVDPVFGSFEYVKFQFVVRQPGSQELLGKFIVRQGPVAQELPAEFIVRQPGSKELSGEFISQQAGSQALLGEFAARRDGSQELGASFDGQATQSLLGEFISRQSSSQDLASKFAVNYWYYISHLVITAGMISGGTLDDTRQKVGDGNDLDLGEVGGAPGFDYEFHFLNAPADEIFGIRMLGFYDGNAAHVVKLYEWNFTLAQWDAVTNAVSDILDAVVDQTYVWMAGGPDYIQGGEYRLRMLHPAAGNPVHELHWDYIWLDEDFAESEDSPPAHFTVRQIGSANLLGGFIVRHPASQELGASFDGQVSLNLSAEFSAGRRSQQELAAGFTVNQSSERLPGEFVSRQPGSQALLAVMNIVHLVDLGAGFKIRRSTSENLLGAVMSRQAGSQNLLAGFIVYNADAPDLLGKFRVRHSVSMGTGIIIAYNPRAWFNYEVDVGTGFISGIKEGSDHTNKAIGESSMGITTRYEKGRNDYVTFGWKYAASQNPGLEGYPGNTLIPKGSREFKGGFLVNQLPNVAAGLRDYNDAAGWFQVTEGFGDIGFETLIIPKADGTIELFGRAIGTTSEYLGFNTYRTWSPGLLGADPVTIVWEVTAGTRIAPGSGSRYNSMTLGALYSGDIPYYPSNDMIFLIYDGEPGSEGIRFYTEENGQSEVTDLTGVFNPILKHKYKIVWSSHTVALYVDNILRASHTTRVPTADLHFGLGVEAVNDQPAPDTCDVSLIFHSFTPLI